MPMPITAHAHGFWVGMGAMLLFMGGHGWAHVMLYVGMGWTWVQFKRKMSGSDAYARQEKAC